ncbi:MAG: transposase [Phocaeicola sp.]
MVNGYSYLDHISWDAYNESTDLSLHLNLYKERFGYYPQEVQADKIYLNKENRKLLKALHIECHCAPLGRPPKQKSIQDIHAKCKASASRNEAEAAFGAAKRTYGANDLRAKLPDTSQNWIAACFFAKNLKRFLRDLLWLLTEIFAILCDRKNFYKLASHGDRDFRKVGDLSIWLI